MTERLLQFIWQFQYFNTNSLATEQGEALQIITQGYLNANQGPDFKNGRIVINHTLWAGNIELHVKASDWHRHLHGTDENYSNIILHVIWEHDEDIKDINGEPLPTLCLQPLVPKLLLQQYEWLMLSQDFVPCQKHLPVLNHLGWLAWKERLAVERLQQKSGLVLQLLVKANNHWEEVFWWMLARNFGAKVNSEIFERLAQSISINILAKHKNQVNQIEALLLGQAGLLTAAFNEDYPRMLQREYVFLSKKYRLIPVTPSPYFLRMRPSNFPTIRLAQLAMLIHQSSHLFSKTKELEQVNDVKSLLNVSANDYWHYHYKFDEASGFKIKQLGKQMVDNIITNTMIPVLFAYGTYTKQDTYKEKALQWMGNMQPEKNIITDNWKVYNVSAKNALESQALIHLKNNYCNQKRCLECAVGNVLLKGEQKTLVS